MRFPRALVHRPVAVVILAGLLSLALVAPTTARSSAPSPQGSGPGPCPTILDASGIHNGDTGTGWTTVRGNTPKPFNFKILGSITNGVANGVDMIIIKVSDAPGYHFMSNIGGIWAGISGSPVYVGGELLGSVSYGFSASPSPIAGVTPAHDMATILGYSSAAKAIASPKANRVAVPRSMRPMLAREGGVSEAQASSLDRIRLPLAISGASDKLRASFQTQFDKLGWAVNVVKGSRATTPSGSSFATPIPGGNFISVLSYGDATGYATGTTTYVCGDQAIAFGHPFTFLGAVTFGASNGYALSIIKDTTFGPYKMANIGGLFGTMDQDRQLGVRATLGEMPPFMPIDSHITSVDTGASRDGHSDLPSPLFLTAAVSTQAFNEILSAADRWAEGVSTLTLTVHGRRANGTPFTYTRANQFASQFDIPDEAAFGVTNPLFALQSQPFQKVTFDSVDITGNVSDTFKAYSILKVLVSKNGGLFKERNHLDIQPGDELTFRVRVRPFQAPAENKVFSMTVPSDASGEGLLSVYGGWFSDSSTRCENDPLSCGSTFNQFLNGLNAETRYDDLIADLSFFGGVGAAGSHSAAVQPQDTGGSPGPVFRVTQQIDSVVQGEVDISVSAP